MNIRINAGPRSFSILDNLPIYTFRQWIFYGNASARPPGYLNRWDACRTMCLFLSWMKIAKESFESFVFNYYCLVWRLEGMPLCDHMISIIFQSCMIWESLAGIQNTRVCAELCYLLLHCSQRPLGYLEITAIFRYSFFLAHFSPKVEVSLHHVIAVLVGWSVPFHKSILILVKSGPIMTSIWCQLDVHVEPLLEWLTHRFFHLPLGAT